MKSWFAAAFLLPTVFLFTAHAGFEQSSPHVTGAFFALVTPNLKASTAWYTEKLGLRVAKEIPEANIVILEAEGLIVELQQPPTTPAARTAVGSVQGLIKAGFLVQDFEKALSDLRVRQVEIAYGPFPARGDQRANVIIKDVDGNLLQLFGQ